MIVKYLFKEPGKDWEIRSHHPYKKSYAETLEQPWCDCDHHDIGNRLMLVFDDLGVLDCSLGIVKYNFNVPSYTDAFENQIYGNAFISKYDIHGEDIDITDEDIDYVKSIVFETDSKNLYSLKDFKSFSGLNDKDIEEILKRYKKNGLKI